MICRVFWYYYKEYTLLKLLNIQGHIGNFSFLTIVVELIMSVYLTINFKFYLVINLINLN
jgi:hypothetical protein